MGKCLSPLNIQGWLDSMPLSWWWEVRPRRCDFQILTGAAKALPARQRRKKIQALMMLGTLWGEKR